LDVRSLIKKEVKGMIRPRCKKRWQERFDSISDDVFEQCQYQGLVPTPYFVEAWHYWHRALLLQQMNLGIRDRAPVGDALQETVPIYDTTRRRYAGFSNVLEQLRYGEAAPKFNQNEAKGLAYPKFKGGEIDWLYLCLVHRVTGSGASFEHDHGWRNTVVPHLSKLKRMDAMARFLLIYNQPIFTSIGNQTPPFNKKTVTGCRNAGHEYLGLVAPKLVLTVYESLKWHKIHRTTPKPGIKPVVDHVLKVQKDLGYKKFKFVLTAWVMDIAEYCPHLVNPSSDCYHGSNAVKALSVCFRPGVRMKKQEFFDRGTRLFADLTGTQPYDVEDASPGCDLIRWLENYLPKHGFEHAKKVFNSSTLYYPHGRQP